MNRRLNEIRATLYVLPVRSVLSKRNSKSEAVRECSRGGVGPGAGEKGVRVVAPGRPSGSKVPRKEVRFFTHLGY